MQATENWIRIETTATTEQLQVVSLDGHEPISRPFEFEVEVVVPGRGVLDAEKLVSSEVTLIFEERDPSGETGSRHREMFRRHGIVIECCDRMLDEGHRSYLLKIAPRLWMTSLVETLDIFMGLSVPDVIRKKLALFDLTENVDYEMRFTNTYEPREFIVQYKETDLDFIGRLTEHWGMSYFFEHRSGSDVVVFTDHNAGFARVDDGDGDGIVPYSQRGERLGVHRLEKKVRVVPRLFVQRDYNYRQPSSDLTASSEMPDGTAGGIVEYGGHFKTEQEGKHLANVRAEEHRTRRWCIEGESGLPSFQGGGRVTVEGAPHGDLSLLLTNVHHHARQASLLASGGQVDPYHNRFEAIPGEVTFRPARRTPKPKIHGVVTGIVDAEQQGKYAELDSEGRYKIKFMFDTSGPAEGKASRAVRMMQPHTGAGYGMHFPLRPGIEVLVTFIDGDPDRPIIAGTVPNPQTQSPVSTDNATRNIIRTGSGNEINIDDNEGNERIKMTTPHLNTAFQLGAPNAPEMGAMLSTTGAISNVSVMGQTSCTSIGSAVTTFRKWSSSKAISTVAESTGKWEKFLLVVESVGAVIGVAGAILGEVENVATGVAAGADAAVSAAEDANNRTEDACNKAKSDAEAIETRLKAAMTPAQQASLDSYKTKVAAAEALMSDEDTGLTALKDARDEAQTKGQTETEKLKNAEIATKQAEYTAAKAEALTAQTAFEAVLTSMGTADATTYQTMLTACKAYRDTRDANDDVIRNANYTKWWVTDGYLGSGIAEAKTVMSVINAVAGWFNMLLSLIGFIKELVEKTHEDAHFGKAGKTFNLVAPQLAATAKAYGFGIPAPTLATGVAATLEKFKPASMRHTVGSEGTMTMFGKERVLVHSPLLVLSGAVSYPEDDAAAATAMTADLADAGINLGPATTATKHKDGSVIVVAEKNALVLGKVEVEVNGLTKATVASQAEVLVSATKQPAIAAGVRAARAANTAEAKLVAKQDGTLLLDATDSVTARADKTLTLKVCTGTSTPKCTLEAKDTGCVTLTTTDSITLKGDNKLSLAAEAAATLELDAAAKKLAAKAGTTELTMADPAGLDAKAGDAKLKLSSTVAGLAYQSNGFEATPSGVKVAGTKVIVEGQAEVQISASGRVLLG